MLTLYNVRDLLEKHRYVSVAEKKAAGARRKQDLSITRTKRDGTRAGYRVVDDPSILDEDDWTRVVAVFVAGPKWQFKKHYPWAAPVDILSNIRGFHLCYEGEAPHANIEKWNVFVMRIHKTIRHRDETIAVQFWNEMDRVLTRRDNASLRGW